MRGPEHHAGVDRVAQVDGVEAAARIHVGYGREAREQIRLRARERDVRALRRRAPAPVAAGVHVHVRVDHAGHHGGVAQVDDARVARDAHVRADLRDSIAANQDRLAGEQRARARIEQPARANRDDLRRRRAKPAARAGAVAAAGGFLRRERQRGHERDERHRQNARGTKVHRSHSFGTGTAR